jgi:hypothetical protein
MGHSVTSSASVCNLLFLPRRAPFSPPRYAHLGLDVLFIAVQLEHVGQRYKGLKGNWTLFSEFIRRRDFIRYGTCISCGKPVSDWLVFDAGHFISAGGGGFALLFEERKSTVSASTTTPSIRTTSSFIEKGLMLDMALERQTRLRKGIETAISKEKRSGTKKQYEAEIQTLKEKLAAFERLFIKLPLYRGNKLSVPQFSLGQLRED